MKYDFDQVCSRSGTSCVKWDAAPSVFGCEDILPLWVADMDFPVATPVVEALKKRAEHPFYGYTRPGTEVISAVVERMKRKFNWDIQPEWVVFTPGVIPALNVAVRACTHPGDEVILQPPIYYPFYSVVNLSGCHPALNQLKLVNGHYEIDFADLEQKFLPKSGMNLVPSRVKALILCSPHNPVGRVWTADELTRMGEIVIQHGSLVIADEIHCELLFKGYRHTPFASISEKFAQNCVICMAPSKTFNLAGLSCSTIIIPNDRLRADFKNTAAGILPQPNLFGYIALEAAYRHGDEWLEQVLDYLQDNLEFMTTYIKKHIPGIQVIKPEGTYLVWLDCRQLALDDMALRDFMRQQAKVGLDDGFVFGPGGSGFQRLNIACPRTVLQEALGRIEKAVKALAP